MVHNLQVTCNSNVQIRKHHSRIVRELKIILQNHTDEHTYEAHKNNTDKMVSIITILHEN